jgi:hypothetical protein
MPLNIETAVENKSQCKSKFVPLLNPLTPELNPSAQRCLTRFLMGILLLEP